jgi:hypothetical protein
MSSGSLRRFWVEIEAPVRSLRSFGVTALDIDDALELIKDYLGADSRPRTANIIAGMPSTG